MMGESAFSFMSSSSWWLVAGALFMALEAFGIPGIGFVFAGLAAITVGALMLSGIIALDAYVIQFSLWFAMTSVMAYILWHPMKRWRVNPDARDQFNNMIGTTATVAHGPLVKGVPGKAKWSGALMGAELASDGDVDELAEGALAEVVEVRGNVLILKPRTPTAA